MVWRQVAVIICIWLLSTHLFHLTVFDIFLHITHALHLILCRAGGGDGGRGESAHERIARESAGDIRDLCGVSKWHKNILTEWQNTSGMPTKNMKRSVSRWMLEAAMWEDFPCFSKVPCLQEKQCQHGLQWGKLITCYLAEYPKVEQLAGSSVWCMHSFMFLCNLMYAKNFS